MLPQSITSIGIIPYNRSKYGLQCGREGECFDRVMELAKPSADTRVLDVGTTPDLQLPSNNFFERWYPSNRSAS